MSIRSFKRAQARRIARERRRATVLARRGALVAGTVLSATTLFASGAQAATYKVTTTGDNNNGTTACTGTAPGPYYCQTLRDAVYTTSNNGQFANTIDLSALSGSIPLTSSYGPMLIRGGALSIDGPGAGTLAVDGQHGTQIFQIGTALNPPPTGPPSVSITGLTLENGSADSLLGNGSNNDGGAVESGGARPLTLANDTIRDSSAVSGGGAVYSFNAQLTISNSTLTGDFVTGTGSTEEGGAVLASARYNETTIVTDSVFSGNHAPSGGGIWANGPLNLSGSQITGNNATDSAGFGGGGIHLASKYGATISGGTVISGNTSAFEGGGAVLQPNAKYSTVFPIQVENSTVSGNQAPIGAGVDIPSAFGLVKISGSTLSGNQGTGTSYGGGLAVDGRVYGKVQLSNSTISGNTATDGGAVSLGGPFNDPLNAPYNTATPPGAIDLGNSTISGNTASSHGGGIFLGEYTKMSGGPEYSGSAALNSTIVSGNSDASGGNDLYRIPASTSGGFDTAFSLIQNQGNAPLLSQRNTILGQNPQLGPLQPNGGPTQTMLPSGTSPVIDQGHSPTDLTTDQRGTGFPRTVDTAIPNPPGGDGTDIGAVELAANQVVIRSAAAASPLVSTGPAQGVGPTAATLTGSVTPRGTATTYRFVYGTTTQYGKSTPVRSAGSGSNAVSVRFRVSGLRPGAVYHYRLTATSAGGTINGGDRTFRTPAKIAVAGVSSGGCTVSTSRTVRVGITSLLGVHTTVRLDGRTVAQGARTLRFRLAHLRRGGHTLTVTSSGGAGTTSRTIRFAVCRTTPTFTG